MPRLPVLPFLLASLFVPAVAAPATTAAQLETGAADLRLFRPALDGAGLLSVDGSTALAPTATAFGLILDAGFRLLPVRAFRNDPTREAEAAQEVTHLVDVLASGTLIGAVGVGHGISLAVQVPVVAGTGPDATVPFSYADPSRGGLDVQGLGDIVLATKVRWLRADRDAIGLAATARLGLPTGDGRRFAGEGSVSLWPALVAEWRAAAIPLRVFGNLGVRVLIGDGAVLPSGVRTEPQGMNAVDPSLTDEGQLVEHGSLLTFAIGGSVRPDELVELLLEVGGVQEVSAVGQGPGTPGLSLEVLAGARVFLDGRSHLAVGLGAGVGNGPMAADVRGVVSFVFQPTVGDRDGDGLKDDYDRCPDVPEDHDGFADDDGCAEPDDDRDGIPDVDDECPRVPEDRDGDADGDGCPEGPGRDRDGDEIVDDVDACPDDPEDRDGFGDDDGCPEPDDDRDGILDVDDLCPREAEDRDDFEDDDGCPDLDDDGDGILDVDDACRLDPEYFNEFEDDDGCPDRWTVHIEGGLLRFEAIRFETDSARIRLESEPVLDGIATALQGRPEITLLEVQGHADERASPAHNLALTTDRAAAVLEALVLRGVERGRLRARGYGERCPIDDRRGPAAWASNRRVEMKVVGRSDGGEALTGDALVCAEGRALYEGSP